MEKPTYNITGAHFTIIQSQNKSIVLKTKCYISTRAFNLHFLNTKDIIFRVVKGKVTSGSIPGTHYALIKWDTRLRNLYWSLQPHR